MHTAPAGTAAAALMSRLTTPPMHYQLLDTAGYFRFESWYDDPYPPTDKHKLQPVPPFGATWNEGGGLILGTSRNVYDWTHALWRTCYCCKRMQNLTFEQFLQTPYTNTDWWPEVMCHMPDVVFTEGNRPFKSVLEMRQKKMQNLLDLRASRAFVGVEIFRLEDVWLTSLNGTIFQYLKQRLAKYNMPFVRNCLKEHVQITGDARAAWLRSQSSTTPGLDLQEKIDSSVLFSYNTTLAQLQAAGNSTIAAELQERVAMVNQLQNWTLEQQLGYGCVGELHGKLVTRDWVGREGHVGDVMGFSWTTGCWCPPSAC